MICLVMQMDAQVPQIMKDGMNGEDFAHGLLKCCIPSFPMILFQREQGLQLKLNQRIWVLTGPFASCLVIIKWH